MSRLASSLPCALLLLGSIAACGAPDGVVADGLPVDNPPSVSSVPAAARVGDLLVYQTPQGDGSSSYVLSARFGDPDVAASDEPSRVSDACELRVIAPGAAGPAQPRRLPDAGRLIVQAGDRASAIDPDAQGAYAVSGVSTKKDGLWTDSAQVIVSASGGAVPAFRVSAPSPPALRLTVAGWQGQAPAGAQRAPMLDRSGAAAFSWDPADAGVVHVQLAHGELVVPGQEPGPVRMLECTWPAADGYGEIPARALAAQPPGEATIRAYVHSSGQATAGDFDITLTLVQDATVAGVDTDLPIVALR